MKAFDGERVLVVGAGISGMAAIRLLKQAGASVRVSEQRPLDNRQELEALGVDIRDGGHMREHLDDIDLVVVSPGVPEGAPLIGWAGDREVPVISELELGAISCSAPYIGVTGTNGKTTTTEMLASIMRVSGLDAVPCGNIGHPFASAALEGHDALVVEASSFQLRFHRSFHPRVSVLLNLAEDHLDWHGAFDAYRGAKAAIYALQTGDDVHVGNAEDPTAADVSRAAPCEVAWFRTGEPGDGEVGFVDGEMVSRLEREIRLGQLIGRNAGFLADAAAATAAALSFGIDAASVEEGLSKARRLPHRGDLVAVIGGISFVNDSKATNPHSALASIHGRKDVVLVAGGLSKGIDLSPLGSVAPQLKGVVAIGEAASEIVGIFEGKVPVRKAGSMGEAVGSAIDLAEGSGTVLLAPACASQDMFVDYRDRGSRFVAAVLSRGGSRG